MHSFLHGDHHVSSRKFLTDLIDQAQSKGQEIIELDGQKLILNELIQATTSDSLFGSDKVVIVENLFSRLKSKEQDTILNWLNDYSGNNPIIFWEKKSIGKILQRKLPAKTTVKEFKAPVVVFKLVEALSPTSKSQALNVLMSALQTEAPEFLFTMIARQIRMLLLLKGGQTLGGAPWMLGKLKKQAEAFSHDNLLIHYDSLYNIDKAIKTGQTIMPLDWHLQVWVTNL